MNAVSPWMYDCLGEQRKCMDFAKSSLFISGYFELHFSCISRLPFINCPDFLLRVVLHRGQCVEREREKYLYNKSTYLLLHCTLNKKKYPKNNPSSTANA